MDKASSSSGLLRTQSNQLAETVVAAMKSPVMSEAVVGLEADGTPSRKLSKRLPEGAEQRGGGGSSNSVGGSSRNARIRKSQSAQMKVELDDLSSGAALSRASSASSGLSLSFSGFVPPDDIADLRPFSDNDEIPEDLEAGTRKKRIQFQAEPTLPIYLKEKRMEVYLREINADTTLNMAFKSGSVWYRVLFT